MSCTICLSFSSPNILAADIARDMPYLRSITFDYDATLKYTSSRGLKVSNLITLCLLLEDGCLQERQDKFWPHLAELKHLHIIRVKGLPGSVGDAASDALLDLVMDTWVTPALKTLRSIRGGRGGKKEEKKIVLRWANKTRTFFA